MNPLFKPVVGVDIGGTKYITAVVDGSGKMKSRRYRYTLSHEGPKKVIRRLVATIEETIETAGMDRGKLGGIGLAVAGLIDTGRGLVTEAPNLPRWKNVPLRDILAGEFNLPVFILNDANAAVLGESKLGAGVGLDNVIFLTISTGIGGGIVLNGELYNGTDGGAGEIGHMIIQEAGPACPCGRHGCLESLASGTAIARMARERLAGWEKSVLTDMVSGAIDEVTASDVARGARQGDPLCLDVVDVAARYLGVGLGNIVNIFNPQMIVIGGGVSGMGEMFLKPARKAMKEHAFKLPARTVRVVRARLGVNSGLLGAALYTQMHTGGKG
jgi:glucokinase